MKKIYINIILILLFCFSLAAQEENEEQKSNVEPQEQIQEENKEEENKENLEESKLEIEDKKEIDSVLFRDPLFGIDYTNKDLGNITDIEIVNERDTLKYTRSYGDWWFGPLWNAYSFSYYLSNYDFARLSHYPVDENNPRVEYTTNPTSSMLNIGGLIEWSPVRQVWGVGGILRYEKLYIDSDHKPTDAQNREFVFNTNVEFDYLTLSPYFKYKTPLEGFNILVIADISYIMAYDATYFRRAESGPSDIQNRFNIDFESSISYKVGLNFGIEYEYFLQDIQGVEFFNKLRFLKNTRVKIAPHAIIGINTSPILNNGGSYPVTFRAGFSFKLGPDKIKGDTVPYNPTPRYEYLAKFDPKVKVQFAGFLERESFASADIDFIETKFESNQVSEEPKLPPSSLRNNDDSQVATTLQEEEKPKYEFKKGFNKTYTYTSSESTNPTRDLRTFLDDLATWMKDNPSAEIRVVGHSDNVGTGQEIQQRSVDRARKVQQYLAAKGINSRRILTNGQGARDPVADIYSSAGRAKNRRVEIVVVSN